MTYFSLSRARPVAKNPEHAIMRRLLSDMQTHTSGWPFLQPVNAEEVADYYEVVKNPMGTIRNEVMGEGVSSSFFTDFSTMEHKLDTNQYSSLEAFAADAQLVFDNCRSYNPEGTVYHKCARQMDRWLKQELATRVKKEDES
jgi:histone acetyltransferase